MSSSKHWQKNLTTGFSLSDASQVDPLLSRAIRLGIGKPPRKFAQWLEEEFVIPTGNFAGQRFRFAMQPITKLWAKEIDEGPWTEYIYTGPSQSGKSLNGYVAPLLYHAHELGERLIFGVPADEMAVDKWESDIRPVMEASHALRKLLPKRGPGSAGGTIRERVSLSNGAVLKIMASGGSDQSKAGYTARVICITEAAGFSESTSTSSEADPLRQIRARQRAYKFAERRTFIEGTKTIKQHLPCTLEEFSSRSRIYCPCPHCGEFFLPSRTDLIGWQDARTEIEAREKAAWQCNKCREPIDDTERYAALCDAVLVHDGQTVDKRGNVTGDLPQTSRLWFDYNAFHNVFLTAGDIAYDCWAAEQIEPETPEKDKVEKQLAQFVFGEAYEPPMYLESEVLIPEFVSERRIPLPRGVAPYDTNRVILGVDVGDRYCHWVLVALRDSQSLHVLDYGTVDVPVRSFTIRKAITSAIVDLVQSLENGVVGEKDRGRIPLSVAYVDSGHEPDAIFDAAKAITTAIEFVPVLGRGETQYQKRKFSLPSKKGNVVRHIDANGRWYISRVQRAAVNQLTLDSDAMKLLVQSGLRISPESSGSITLFDGPSTVHRKFAKHLTSEQRVPEEIPGEAPKLKWHRTGANHYFDALTYGAVASLRFGWSPESKPDAPTQPTTWQGD
jgi:phage terminase large subunit GpA-like protein